MYDQTLELLKEKHRAAYKAFHTPASAAQPKEGGEQKEQEEEVLATPVATADNTQDYTDDLLGFTCELAPTEVDGIEEVSDDTKANDLVDEWIKHSVSFNKHVLYWFNPLPKSGNISLLELVAKFDTMQYFRDVGSKDWPTITMLARIHCFSRMDNSAFQERVFSTAANVQGKTQNRMAFEHVEKRTLIAHNKELLREKII